MKWLVSFGLLLCMGILVVVACAAPAAAPAQPPQVGVQETPTVTSTPTPEAPPKYLISLVQTTYTVTIPDIDDYSEVEKKAGCNSPFPFDGREAYNRHPQEHWLLWTFSVSFDAFAKKNEGGPLGCLRLYQRNDVQDTFDLIQNGNILVDTCQVGSGVTFNSGSAIFDGTGHITCTMNLSDWVTKLSSPLGLVLTRTVDSQMVIVSDTFTSTHTYDNFTIAAAIVPTITNTSEWLPLVYYEPKDDSTEHTKLVLTSKMTFPTLQISVEGCDRTVGDPDEQVWWYDLRGQDRGTPMPEFQATPTPYAQHVHNALDGPSNRNLYGEYEGEALCPTVVEPIEFSLEEAKLHIGYDVDKKETFTGEIDAILIDPTDSKPEKS